MKLQREFYLRGGLEVAKDLIGKKLVHNSPEGLTAGIIVEVEAYLGKIDAAAYSFKGRTARTEITFGAGGFAYIYLIYGKNICMNVVANVAEIPDAILIRALQPVEGLELMQARRQKNNLRELCNGPGKLTQAMAITKNHYGADLCGEELFIETAEDFQPEIIATKRINVDYAGDAANFLWRFIQKNNPCVSK